MGIFDSTFRNKIGAPSKKELLNQQIKVYEQIIKNRNDLESETLNDFESQNNVEWKLLHSKQIQIQYKFINSLINQEDYLNFINKLDEELEELISDYIDNQDEDTIYGILKNNLKRIKQENIDLPNIKQMEFDFWKKIVESAELAQLSILQIKSDSDYIQASKDDKIIRDYQVRKHFRK